MAHTCLASTRPWIQTPILPKENTDCGTKPPGFEYRHNYYVTIHVTSTKLLNFSVLYFPHLWNKDDSSIYLIKLLCGLKDTNTWKSLATVQSSAIINTIIECFLFILSSFSALELHAFKDGYFCPTNVEGY
jgi:hypothetical protein